MSEDKNTIYGEGGGGCFPAGTQINTPHGYKNIEEIQVGDEVYSFSIKSNIPGELNWPGKVEIKKVTETFIHSYGEVGYTSKLLVITHEKGELVVTGNHYILTPSRQSRGTDVGFARADALRVSDVLYTQYGEKTTILSIKKGNVYDYVYNFEVEDFSTYIASKIRVHNGGGSKSAKQAKIAPNSIRTNQIVRVLNLVSEGETKGPWNEADPAQSIFFDGTPLKNPGGSFNFAGVKVNARDGTPFQTVIPGFSSVETENVASQDLLYNIGIVKTLDSAIDGVRITIQFPQGMQTINPKSGDTSAGNVIIQIHKRNSGGTFVLDMSKAIKEVSVGAFEVCYRVERPVGSGPWEFRVTRTTPNSTSNFFINATMLSSYTEMQYVTLSYNNRALYSIEVGADSTNNRIPLMAADWGGILCSVPNNYNATTKIYSGSWSGTLSPTKVWTDNPAWLLLELIRNTRYGLGDMIADSQIDFFSFYDAAVYCDELVDDGNDTGTFENRFTFNAQLMVREDAWKTLQSIASAFRAKIYVAGGYIKLSQDRPTTSTRIIGNSQVIDGFFNYASTAGRTRYTACNVSYTDVNDNCLPKTVSEVATTEQIARYGFLSTDIVSYGATSEGQARRDAKWLIDTNINTTELVDFTVGPQYADFEPGEVFSIMDTDYAQVSQEGRLVSIVGNTLVLDQPLNKTTNPGWTITLIGSDGVTLHTRLINSAIGISATITVAGIAPPVAAGTPYIISGSVKPRQFKVLSLVESDELNYAVSAIQYDPTKYVRVESGIIIPPPLFFQSPSLYSVDTPSALIVNPLSSINTNGVTSWRLGVSWTAPVSKNADSYRIAWSRNNSVLNILTSKLPSIILPDALAGDYEFYINAINSASVASPTLFGEYALDTANGTGSGIGPVTGLQIVGGGTTFGSASMNVEWVEPVDVVGYPLQDYKVELQVPAGGVFKTFYTTVPNFQYSYDDNVKDGGPRSSIKVNVYARDAYNKTSIVTTNTFTSIVGSGGTVSSLTVRGGGTSFTTRDLEVVWTATGASGGPFQNDPSFGFYKVEVLSGATVLRTEQTTQATYTYSFQNNVKDNGQDTPLTSIIIRITAYNNFGVGGASTSTTFTPGSPPVITSLYTQGTSVTTFTTPDLTVAWVSIDGSGNAYAASNVFKHFKVEFLNGATVKRTIYTTSASATYTWDMNAADNGGATRTPSVRVSAVNVYNGAGSTNTTAFSNATPAVPSNIAVVGGLGSVKISYDLPSDPDFAGVYIWGSTTSGFTPSSVNLLATATGTYTSLTGLPNSTTYYIKLAAFDTFEKSTSGTGMNVSTQSSASTSASPGIPSFPTAPGSGAEGDIYVNTTDGQLYRYHSGAWTAAVPSVNITGTLTDAQLAAIAAAKITGTIVNSQIADVASTKITGTLTDAQLAAIAAAKITGQITTTQITNNSITTGKIAAGAVTASEIAADTITASQIAANAITSSELASGSVTTAKLVAGAVTANEIAANTITAAKIAAGTITTAEIAAGTIVAADIASGTITATQIASGTITATQIAASTITSNELAANSVIAGKIAANAVTSATIAAGAVTTGSMVANSITGDRITVGTLNADRIAANTITASQIAAGTITATEIAAGTITAAKIASGTITATQIAAGTITTNKLVVGAVTAATSTASTGVTRNLTPGPTTFTETVSMGSFTGTGAQVFLQGAVSIRLYNLPAAAVAVDVSVRMFVIGAAFTSSATQRTLIPTLAFGTYRQVCFTTPMSGVPVGLSAGTYPLEYTIYIDLLNSSGTAITSISSPVQTAIDINAFIYAQENKV